MKEFLLISGTWLLSDAVYSWIIYLNADSYNGKKQTFKRDHWLRLVRAILAIGIIITGVML